MMARVTVALVGNPNTGKTTLFNALTGARERVGNWSGVTVEKAQAVTTLAGQTVRVVDLPGIFSLDGHTPDERVTGAFLSGHQADLVVNVLDASNLERSLCLTRELLDLGVRPVVALNLVDVASRRGVCLDATVLEQALGCPVVPVVASRGEGLAALRAALALALTREPAALSAETPTTAMPEESAQARREFARSLARTVVRRDAPPGERRSDRVDRVLLSGRFGVPFFLGIMYMVFWLTVRATQPLVEFMDAICGAFLVHGLRAGLEGLHCPEILISVLADGAGTGLVAVATFIPPIFAIFLCLGVLEGTGYMPRAAFVMDRLLRKVGLPGKAFIPLVVGFGCTVPGMLATRTLAQRRERILTMLITPFMSCGARLPVYTVFALAFFPRSGGRVVFALYVTGIVLAVLSGLLLHRTVLRGSGSACVVELPPYQLPPLSMCLDHAWFNLRCFLVRAGQVIVGVALALSLINATGNALLRSQQAGHPAPGGLSGRVGRAVTPVFWPMGIESANWPATVGLITGVLAKESVIGTLDVLYAQAGSDSAQAASRPAFDARAEVMGSFRELGERYHLIPRARSSAPHGSWPGMLAAMRRSFGSGSAAFAYLLFVLVYSPCLAALAVLAREAGWRWMAFSVMYQTLLAWMTATAFYQVATYAAHPPQTRAWLAVVAAMTVLLVAAMRWRGQHAGQEVVA